MAIGPLRVAAASNATLIALALASCGGGDTAAPSEPTSPSSTSPSESAEPTESATASPSAVPGQLPFNPSGVALETMGESQFLGSIPASIIGDKEKVMYLTFDDGPDPKYTPMMLDMLAKHDAKATFFVLGKNVKKYPEWIEKIQEAGHAIGSHSYTHANLAKLTPAKVKAEMVDTDAALKARTSCMRPPYGSTNASTKAQLKAMNKWVLHWDLGSGDWEHRSAQQISNTLVKGAKNGALTLMHDGGGKRDATVRGVNDAITKLKADGWTFEVLPMCQLEELA